MPIGTINNIFMPQLGGVVCGFGATTGMAGGNIPPFAKGGEGGFFIAEPASFGPFNSVNRGIFYSNGTGGGAHKSELFKPDPKAQKLLELLIRNVPAFRKYYKGDRKQKAIAAFKTFENRIELKGRIAHLLYELLRGGINRADPSKGLDSVDVEMGLSLVERSLTAKEAGQLEEFVNARLAEMQGDERAMITLQLITDEGIDLPTRIGAMLSFAPIEASSQLAGMLTTVIINVSTRILFPGIEQFQNSRSIKLIRPEAGTNRNGGWHFEPEKNAQRLLVKWLREIRPMSDELYETFPGDGRQLTREKIEGVRGSKRRRYKDHVSLIERNLEKTLKMATDAQTRIITAVLQELGWEFSELQKVVARLKILTLSGTFYMNYIIEKDGKDCYTVTKTRIDRPTRRTKTSHGANGKKPLVID